MSESKSTDAANDDHVGTEDPELEALLKFEPAPRQNKRRDGWTAALQRRFIAELARSGSPTLAAEAVGKNRYGVEKVYKSPGADGFRAAWDSAVALFEERVADRAIAQHADRAAARPPFVDRRRARGAAQSEPEPEPEVSEDEKWELIQRIGLKFMRKVAQEREARLNGEIVAADFYLRQITMNEVIFDLLAAGLGWDAQEALRELRRGDHKAWQIACTDFSDWLDASRREWWRQEGEPERPSYPDVRFLERHRSEEGEYATEPQMYAGAWADPPHGVDKEEWLKMTKPEQEALIERIQEQHAEEQRAWEAKAHREFESRRGSAT